MRTVTRVRISIEHQQTTTVADCAEVVRAEVLRDDAPRLGAVLADHARDGRVLGLGPRAAVVLASHASGSRTIQMRSSSAIPK